ncbi:Phospholipase/carboxylesterase [Dothidotthia symphoricarpi CBS 119687]|uniref:Acyl-protein thioesterase 1 n=1 Tax=Dothidotthia symphoricarpi CBS 119687 TaxID=1392245 RepID=A0A6A6AIJ2_9PLEO|nr:Phospholipase/carboxylesterase [Dothidotthia symphoricarpi CBS 119687]KAF2130727.1 Phospholipase/carboxylesterase [Dothidotthia symphoricarpi CBS 119687]
MSSCVQSLIDNRIFLAENWRRRSKFEEVSFVFPNAPSIPITLNMGMRMPGWYDIKSLSSLTDRSEDTEGITKSRDYFHSLIDQEIAKGIPANRIVIGGFSQGGAMSLLSGVTYKNQLGGIFGLSCYLLLQRTIKDMIPTDTPNQKTPIFMGHGDKDNVVAYKYGQMSAEELTKLGYNVDFRTYKNLAHSADAEEIDHLESYLKQQIPPLGDAKLEPTL